MADESAPGHGSRAGGLQAADHGSPEDARLVDVLMQSPIAVAVTRGADHRYELTNAPYLEMVQKQDIVGKTIAEVWPETVGTPLMDVFDRVFQTGEPFVTDEYRTALNRNGQVEDCYFKFNLVALRDTDGSISGMATTAVEITELVKARDNANSLAKDLAASEVARVSTELLFQKMADTMAALAWYADPDGTVPWFNDRWYEYTGIPHGEINSPARAEVVHPEDRPRVLELWRSSLESGERWEDQFRLRRHDGAYRWFLSRAEPLRDEEGQVVRWFGTNVDIEDQKRAEKSAEAASRAKDEFLAVLGHELRNPLAPILTALHLMSERGSGELERERAIIERQANHLVRLVDDLLDVSRITRGKVELRRSHVELAQLVAKAIEIASPLLENGAHELAIEVPTDGLVLDVDPARIAQVIANLLTNAAKYTAKGGRIVVSGERDGEDIVLRVRDNGIGISPEMARKVFGMFAQERQALDRSQGGLGLGLTIVRSLLKLHGGTVSLHSEGRGQGTEVKVRLPGAREDSTPVEDTKRKSVPVGDGNGKRILVVDDNEDAAEMLATSLEIMGHTVRVSCDGPSALQVLDDFTPEVGLLDIGLPVMDGYELARRLRGRFEGEDLTLIAITGYGQRSDRERSKEAGFDVHLVKPVTLAQLAEVLEPKK